MKTKLAIFVAGLLTATSAQYLSRVTPRGTTFMLVNAEVQFPTTRTADGGIWPTTYRACAYETAAQADGGMRRIAEPCWRGELAPSISQDLATSMLNAALRARASE